MADTPMVTFGASTATEHLYGKTGAYALHTDSPLGTTLPKETSHVVLRYSRSLLMSALELAQNDKPTPRQSPIKNVNN